MTVNVQPDLISKSVSSNGVYKASTFGADGFLEVTVDVGVSLSSADNGKVVRNGSLVAQTSIQATMNGTYDTETYNLVVVSVPVDGGTAGEAYGLVDGTETSIALGVSYVRPYALCSLRSLLSADFPACKSVGYRAFSGCVSLKTVSLPLCERIHDNAFENCFSLESACLPNCSLIGYSAFANCSSMSVAEFPKCTEIYSGGFSGCINLGHASFPECSRVGSNAFSRCSNLSEVYIPKCNAVYTTAFCSCLALSSINLPSCSLIYTSAFLSCYNLTTLDLTGVTSVPVLNSVNAFSSTPLYNYSASAGKWGSILVPASLYSAFLSASNWSNASIRTRIVSV